MTYVGPVLAFVMPRAANWNRFSFCSGTFQSQTTERYLGCKQRIRGAVNDRIGIEPQS